MSVKPALGGAPKGDAYTHRFLSDVKQNIELMQGITGVKVQPLAAAATLAQVIAAFNALLAQVAR